MDYWQNAEFPIMPSFALNQLIPLTFSLDFSA